MDQYRHPPHHRHDPYQQYPPYPPPHNGSAVAALVLGILSIIIPYIGFILGIIAIVIGYRALKLISPAQFGAARGLATAGLVCGIVGVSIYGLILMLMLFAALISGL